jgi:hypothetical protein
MHTNDTVQTQALPADVVTANLELMATLAASAWVAATRDTIDVTFEGTIIRIPYRVYYAVETVDAAIQRGGDGAIVAACLGSRSNDGYLRQRCVETMLTDPRPWSVPYLVETLGEYVIEILQVFDGRVPERLEPEIAQYLVANEAHVLRLCRRCVSYWNEMYRYPGGGVHILWRDYVGAHIIANLVGLARTVSPLFAVRNSGAIPNGSVPTSEPSH